MLCNNIKVLNYIYSSWYLIKRIWQILFLVVFSLQRSDSKCAMFNRHGCVYVFSHYTDHFTCVYSAYVGNNFQNTLMPGDYNSFAMVILNQNHKENDSVELISASIIVIIACTKGYS